ncbi:CaiB/BaiF CoA-transferase family protein [Pigmentiphaga sp. NML080357]|uniref:CaiB/BaiF CoA transferase family protein n=1 Tax=Pigmentiphaga sp. NML080357 TaxID=2008675 RepID=UPI001303D15C|nr:CoA transferase [Pigmentiphaga sp. NML080357]
MNFHSSPNPAPDAEPAATALAGVRVLDLSRVIAGPWCTQILGDLGADVIKVERPGAGDDSRAWAPPFMCDDAGNPTGESVSFSACNRGKRSVEIDLSDPAAAALLRDLAAQADVLVENFKAGTLARYGLDYAALSARNPALIYCSITGFGQTGPYRDRPGYDTIIQGMCGLMSFTGQPDDVAGGGPVKAGLPVIDLMSGLYAAVGILAALQRRSRSGRGQHIDLALLDVGVASLAHLGLRFLAGNGAPRRHGNRLPMVAPSDAYGCRDGRIMLIVGNDQQFRKFCRAFGLAQLETDPRYATNEARLAHSAELDGHLHAAFASRTVDECVRRCSEAGVPCGPINDVERVFSDPQVQARGMVAWLPHARTAGSRIPTIASPLRLSESPVVYRHAAPDLGQHNAEVYGLAANSGTVAWPVPSTEPAPDTMQR